MAIIFYVWMLSLPPSTYFNQFSCVIFDIIEHMSKVVTAGYYVKRILSFYLKGIADRDANIHRIQQLIYTADIQKLEVVGIYQLLSHDPNNKLQSIIKLLDKKLMEYKEYPTSDNQSKSDGFNLALHVYRLRTLVKYNLPYEETVQILLQNILINNLTEADFNTIFSLLQIQPSSHSKSYSKLMSNIFDLLQQHLTKNEASHSFINSTVKYIYKSSYKIPKSLNKAINDCLDRHLPTLDVVQMMTISHFMREKSLNQWVRLGFSDFSLVRRRIIFQYILNKQYNGLHYQKHLPGRIWATSQELQEAIKCIKSIGSKQAFIDIFPVEQILYTNPLEGYAALRKVQFSNHYIDNLFNFIKNGCRKFDLYSFYRIIRTLRSFFSDGIENPPCLKYFSNFVQHYSINVLTLAIVIYEMARYQIAEKERLHQITRDYLNIINALITPELLKNMTYDIYKYLELTTLYNYIYCIAVDHLANVLNKQTNEDSINRFKKIEVLLESQKERKYVVNEYSKLSAFYRYVKAVSERKEVKFGGKEDFLLQQYLKWSDLKEIIQEYNQTSHIIDFSTDIPIFQTKYKILTNILLQPNLEMKYAIVQKHSSKVVCFFDYKQLIDDRLAYEIIEETVENGVVVLREQHDLTLLGAWRKKFFNTYYQSQYYYCRAEIELALKFAKIIKKLSQP